MGKVCSHHKYIWYKILRVSFSFIHVCRPAPHSTARNVRRFSHFPLVATLRLFAQPSDQDLANFPKQFASIDFCSLWYRVSSRTWSSVQRSYHQTVHNQARRELLPPVIRINTSTQIPVHILWPLWPARVNIVNIIVFQSLFASTGRQRSDSLQGIREQTDIHISWLWNRECQFLPTRTETISKGGIK